jgi:hypothetical protein
VIPVYTVSILKGGQRAQEAGVGAYIKGMPIEGNLYQPLVVEGRWLQPGDDSTRVRLICADGGARAALALSLTPEVVVGDLDSLDGAMQARLKAMNAQQRETEELVELFCCGGADGGELYDRVGKPLVAKVPGSRTRSLMPQSRRVFASDRSSARSPGGN